MRLKPLGTAENYTDQYVRRHARRPPSKAMECRAPSVWIRQRKPTTDRQPSRRPGGTRRFALSLKGHHMLPRTTQSSYRPSAVAGEFQIEPWLTHNPLGFCSLMILRSDPCITI